AAKCEMVEIVPHGGCLAALYETFGGPVAEGGDGFGAIPGKRLPFAAGPYGDPVDDFGHLIDTRLRRCAFGARAALGAGARQARGFRQFALGDAEPFGHGIHSDDRYIDAL